MTIRRERGKDGVLTVGNTQFPFTNCDFSAEYEISSNDWNDDFFQYTSYINGRATGSYEFVGSVPPARDALVNQDGTPKSDLSLQVRLREETFRATRVTIESYDRSVPADDNTSGTVEWSADRFRFLR